MSLHRHGRIALNLQMIGDRLGEDFVYELGCQAGKDAAKEIVRSPNGGPVAQHVVMAGLGA
jgi:hypothetical protein